MLPIPSSYDLLRSAILTHPVLRARSNYHSHVYLTSNEEKIALVRNAFSSSQLKGGIYCGVSGLQNWDFISLTQPDLALLIDKNQATVDFQNAVINLIKTQPNRHSFLKKLEDLVQSYPEDFFADNFLLPQKKDRSTPLLEIDNLSTLKHGAFASKKAFNRVKNLALNGRIIALSLDLTKEIEVSILATMIKTHNCYLSCLYLSNVGDWVHRIAQGICDAPNLQAFKRNINRLISPSQTHILESTWFGYDPELYRDGDYQMVLSMITPGALGPLQPYDPCIFRGAIPNVERSAYFANSLLLDPLPSDASGKHKRAAEEEKTSHSKPKRLLPVDKECPT